MIRELLQQSTVTLLPKKNSATSKPDTYYKEVGVPSENIIAKTFTC